MHVLDRREPYFESRVTKPQTTGPTDGGGLWSRSIEPAGVYVNEDRALSYAATWCAMRVLAETTSKLAWLPFREFIGGTDDSEITYKVQNRHPLRKLLNRKVNGEMASFTWRDTSVAWAVTVGNHYSEIERSRDGRPVALWPIENGRTVVDRDSRGQLIYDISNQGASRTVLNPSDVFHLKGPSPDGLVGYSLIRMASQSLGLGISMEKFVSLFFSQGGNIGGFFKHPGVGPARLSPEAFNRLQTTLDTATSGLNSAHKYVLLEEGVDFQAAGVSDADKAQMTDSRKHQVLDICRWFKIPPHKLMHLADATFSNIEQQNKEFADEAIMPWVLRSQAEADTKLFLDPEEIDFLSMMDLSMLNAADLKARGEYNRAMWGIGALSANQVLAREGMNSIGPDGDVRYVPVNMQPVEFALMGPQAKSAPGDGNGDNPDEDNPDNGDEPPDDENTDDKPAKPGRKGKGE